jgi:hypothetical protein
LPIGQNLQHHRATIFTTRASALLSNWKALSRDHCDVGGKSFGIDAEWKRETVALRSDLDESAAYFFFLVLTRSVLRELGKVVATLFFSFAPCLEAAKGILRSRDDDTIFLATLDDTRFVLGRRNNNST